jgi:hypothetical protein
MSSFKSHQKVATSIISLYEFMISQFGHQHAGSEQTYLGFRSLNIALCLNGTTFTERDTMPGIVIEVSNSQKFYAPWGLKWNLSQEILGSLGDIKVGLGLKINSKQPAWNPHLSLYRPDYNPNLTGTGGTMRVKEVFEQIRLTCPDASQDSFTLTLCDFISGQNRPAILAQFPGLQMSSNCQSPLRLPKSLPPLPKRSYAWTSRTRI